MLIPKGATKHGVTIADILRRIWNVKTFHFGISTLPRSLDTTPFFPVASTRISDRSREVLVGVGDSRTFHVHLVPQTPARHPDVLLVFTLLSHYQLHHHSVSVNVI